MNPLRASVSRNIAAKIDKIAAGAIAGRRAINAGPIEKVRAASSIARLRKKNGPTVRSSMIEGRHPAAHKIDTAKIGIIVHRQLRNHFLRLR